MVEFNPRLLGHYRESTLRHEKTAGITLNHRKCGCCGRLKSQEGAKVIRGTSRHNPSKFICAECK